MLSQLSSAMRPINYFHPAPAPQQSGAADGKRMTEERLAFSVRVVRNEKDLSKAVSIRHSAYARHMPDFAEKLRHPEPMDEEPGVVVLLAESKLDGSPLGTIRIQSNAYTPLTVEQTVTLPRWLRDRPLIEGSRLGIVGGTIGRLVKTVLIKATLRYCESEGIDWAIVAARAPIDRQYAQLLFEDLYPDQGFIPMRHGNNIPHRVMGFEIETGHQRLVDAMHPMLNFMSYTHHPDIDVSVEPEVEWGGLFPAPAFARATSVLGRRSV